MTRPTSVRWVLPLALLACQEVRFDRVSDTFNPDSDEPDAPRPEDTVPPIATCGANPNPAAPGETVRLVGENSYDPDGIPLINYRWRLEKAPDGSATELPPGQANILGVIPDLVGEYVASLIVTNDRGRQSDICTTTLRVAPEDDLYIELIPSLEDDDLKLVLVRGDDPNGDDSCSQDDCSADWGANGADDADPELVFDDVNGGPEAIGVMAPAAGVYSVRVDDDLSGVLISEHEVEVVVHVKGQAKWRDTISIRGDRSSTKLVRIAWPSGNVTDI